MPDWRAEVRRHLERSRLAGSDEAEVVEELAQHLEDRYDELLGGGVPPEEAARRVAGELRAEDALPEALGALRARHAPAALPPATGPSSGGLPGVWQDVRYGVRVLRQRPAFSLAAVLALGLGAGAATAVFALLQGVVLRPLPFPEPERLVTIRDTKPAEALDEQLLSPVTFLDYRALSGTFEDAAAWWRPEVNLLDGVGEPVRVSTVEASENLFEVLGAQPVLGRAFPRDSTLHGDEAEAVISHRLWRTRFGGDPGVLGRTLRLNGFPYSIVGVMPEGFHFPEDTDVWQRLMWDLSNHSRGAHFMGAVARLREGATVERANRELGALGVRLAAEFPATNEGWAARAVPLAVDVAGVFRPGLFALFGASGLLLLIACTNVASLLLARANGRQGEVAVRAALGASRGRLVRQLLIENLLLAVAGALVGLGVAVGAVRALLAWSPVEIPRAADVGIDAGVLAFTLLVTAVTALVFGLVPALLAARTDLSEALRGSGRASGGRGRRRAGNALVVAEVGLAVALLAGAALLIRSVSALLQEETGVAAGNAVTVDLQLPDADYDDWSRVAHFYGALLSELRAEPRIEAVGAGNFLPLETGWRIPVTPADAPAATEEDMPLAQYHTVDEGYFDALGIALLRGRGLRPGDDADAPAVVVVNQSMAERLWPGEEAVGRRIRVLALQMGPLGRRLTPSGEAEVVGVVADVKNTALTDAAEPAVYWSVRQFPFRRMNLVLRGPGGAGALLPTVRAAVQRLDPALPLGGVRTLETVLTAAADPPRFVMFLMSGFAVLALTLATIGIYGILSYTVSQRRREISVRLALGARPGTVLRQVVGEGVALALAGTLLGVAAAAAGGRLLSGLLYGVEPTDPLSLALVASVVLAIAALACLGPGRRAASTEPILALRGD